MDFLFALIEIFGLFSSQGDASIRGYRGSSGMGTGPVGMGTGPVGMGIGPVG